MKYYNISQTDRIITILNGISAILIIIGAILKITHNQYGNLTIFIGLISSYILKDVKINRLKKIIKKLKNENTLDS